MNIYANMNILMNLGKLANLSSGYIWMNVYKQFTSEVRSGAFTGKNVIIMNFQVLIDSNLCSQKYDSWIFLG